MKTKNTLLLLGATAMATCAYAYTELVETMTVELNDGRKVEYVIEDVAKVSFDVREETTGLLISAADGSELYRSETLAPVFRYAPEEENAHVQFLFGSVDTAADLVNLKDGKYMAMVDFTDAGLFAENVSLAGESAAATVVLYEWTDGEISEVKDVVAEGTVTTSRSSKGVVTMELDATFADGTALRASYNGTPVDVADLEAIFPTPTPKNEINYYNMDGVLSNTLEITGFAKTDSSDGRVKYTAQFENSSEKCYIEMLPEYIGQVINFAEQTETNSGAPYYLFYYGSIQLASPNGQYRNQGMSGTMQVIENEDGTVTITADVTNWYKAMWGEGKSGTPERVTIEYTGECEGLAPKAKNTVEYYNMDGDLSNNLAITSFAKTNSSDGRVKYTAQFENSSEKCYIEMLPEYIGQVINFAEHTETNSGAPYYLFHYGSIQLASPNGQYRNQGMSGTMQVVENGDGTVTINADVTNWYKAMWGDGKSGTPERVVIEYRGECSGL